MAFCRLLTALVLIHNTGGLLGAEVKSSIVGGQNAPENGWPWMVHLNITTTDGKKKWRCGGTLLNDQWILTAANCWDSKRDPSPKRSSFWIGAHDLKEGALRYVGGEFAILHPKYQARSTGFVNDIALVKMLKKLTFSESVKPVSLPSVDDTYGPSSECWITGWGYVDDGAPLSDPETLQQLKIPIVPQSVCKQTYPDLTSEMLCAGDTGKDACEGDYGGPLVCRTAKGFVQVGIMSYGSPEGCGLPGRPGVYTQVSKYLRFINDYIHT